jgi:hypothetical protein
VFSGRSIFLKLRIQPSEYGNQGIDEYQRMEAPGDAPIALDNSAGGCNGEMALTWLDCGGMPSSDLNFEYFEGW